jgi:hypothetical protein
LSKKRTTTEKRQAQGGLSFLSYLRVYIQTQEYWLSWSPGGALEASKMLNIPVEDIMRTTNTLESFNGRVKNEYLEPYMHGGKLPRIDIWMLLVVTKIIPNYYSKLSAVSEQEDYRTSMRRLPNAPVPTNPPRSILVCDHPDLKKADEWLQELENEVDDSEENEELLLGDQEIEALILETKSTVEEISSPTEISGKDILQCYNIFWLIFCRF